MERARSSKHNQSRQELTAHDIINQLNIRYRVCYVYTPDKNSKKDKTSCECNQPKEAHKIQDNPENLKWSMEQNTKEKVDPRHGQLSNKSWFIRLALDTPQEKVEKILLEAWKIPKPRFIVSIIGGAKYFKLNDRLETNFINGVVDIIQKSNAWLLTSGYNVGIVQLVGQAINKVKLTNLKTTITAIGICKWGSVKDVEIITRPKSERTEQVTTTGNNRKDKKERASGEWDLEMNHSHYLMLDDGRYRQFDTKDYRTRLATHMARLQHENDVFVPVVTIVVEGGRDTITNMCYDLKSTIPVVIIDGSGRAADFFARWYLYTKDVENDPEYRETVYGIDELKLAPIDNNVNQPGVHVDANTTMLSKIFKKYQAQIEIDLKNIFFPDDDRDKVIKDITDTTYQVMYCLQPAVRSDITIFNLNSDSDLTETIFRSICQSRQKLSKRKENDQNTYRKTKPATDKRKKVEILSRSFISKKERSAERTRLLDLAMDWDCIDVAKEFILQNSLDNILNKTQAFKTALTKNLPTFVYEFLKLGINPSEVFFLEDGFYRDEYRYKKFFKNLYTIEAVNSSKTHLKYFIEADKDISGRKIDSVETLNLVLSTLIGDHMHKLYFDTLEQEEENRISWGLKKPEDSLWYNPKQHKHENLSNLSKEGKNKLDQISQDYIMRDLFIWAVLMNYPKLAIVFLSHMKYRICPALIATKIFKEYEQKATYGDLKDGYEESAKYFEQYAINCLDKSDDHDDERACQIILQQNELYGYVSCLQVAADAHDKLFIATPCCVEALDNTWYDKLNPEQNRLRNHVALFVGFISLGLLAPVFVSYRKTKREPKKDDPKVQKLGTRGINYCDPHLLEYSHEPVPKPEHTRYWPKLKKFHQSLPAKFFYHVIFYCFFLLLFSYFLLFNFSPPTDQIPSIHWTEILTIIIVSCMLIEEIHYFFSQDSLTFFGRSKKYFRDIFKPMTLLAFLLFYIGLIVRFRYASSEDNFVVARVIMAIDVEIWWLRTLSFIIVIPFLGPHLVAIGKMLRDLVFFMCIIAIVMAGYGVASRSMVYFPVVNNFTTETGGPVDASFDGRAVFRYIAYPVYYLLYGQFGYELQDLDDNPNAGWSIATHVLLAAHMIFVNILLFNMLIAMFSQRFDEVYDDTQNIWHSQQYLFTREYFTRSPFFPPISLLRDVYYLCRMFFFFINRKVFKKSADHDAIVFKMISLKESTIKEWCEFEDASTYEYAHGEVKTLKTTSIKSTLETDSDDKDKKDDTAENDNDSNNAFAGLRQVQNDLIDLSTIIEEMKGQLDRKIDNKTA